MGSLFGYQQAGVPFKQWLTQKDKDVRDSHAEMDDVIIPMDEQFEVGDGKLMDGPGDPAGGPEEICNCRCTVIGIFSDQSDGTE
jgi:uncharacterized protein with gpF-like domain